MEISKRVPGIESALCLNGHFASRIRPYAQNYIEYDSQPAEGRLSLRLSLGVEAYTFQHFLSHFPSHFGTGIEVNTFQHFLTHFPSHFFKNYYFSHSRTLRGLLLGTPCLREAYVYHCPTQTCMVFPPFLQAVLN